MPRFEKGSKEAKEYMAMLRAKRGQMSGKGANNPAPAPAPAPAPVTNNGRMRINRPPALNLTEAQRIQREDARRAGEAEEQRQAPPRREGQGFSINLPKMKGKGTDPDPKWIKEQAELWKQYERDLNAGEIDERIEDTDEMKVMKEERKRVQHQQFMKYQDEIRAFLKEVTRLEPQEASVFINRTYEEGIIPAFLINHLVTTNRLGIQGDGIFEMKGSGYSPQSVMEIDPVGRRLIAEERARREVRTAVINAGYNIDVVDGIMREADRMNPHAAVMFVRSLSMEGVLPQPLINFLVRYYRWLLPTRQGAGIFDDISKKLVKTAKKTSRRVVNKVQNATVRTDYPPKIRKLLAKNGDKVIASAVINRKPVKEKLTNLLNVLSFGQFKKNIAEEPYDDLFHLSIVLNTTDGKTIMVEKNEVLNMAMTGRKGGETYPIAPFSTGKTLNEIMENTRKKMGDEKFFSYSARNNNCQDFIMSLLQANGMGDADEFKFVKQDTKQMFKGLKTLSNVADFITDIAGTADVLIKGKGLETIL